MPDTDFHANFPHRKIQGRQKRCHKPPDPLLEIVSTAKKTEKEVKRIKEEVRGERIE